VDVLDLLDSSLGFSPSVAIVTRVTWLKTFGTKKIKRYILKDSNMALTG